MTKIFAVLALLATVTPCLAATPADLRRSAVGQDYAVGACLHEQPAGPLRTEADSLLSIAINGTDVPIERFAPIAAAVKRAMARTPMYAVHVDAPVAQSTRFAPLAYCLAMARSPAVVAAIGRLPIPGPMPR